METRLEHTIQTPSRSVPHTDFSKMVSLLLGDFAAPRLLVQKIDEFAASPVARA